MFKLNQFTILVGLTCLIALMLLYVRVYEPFDTLTKCPENTVLILRPGDASNNGVTCCPVGVTNVSNEPNKPVNVVLNGPVAATLYSEKDGTGVMVAGLPVNGATVGQYANLGFKSVVVSKVPVVQDVSSAIPSAIPSAHVPVSASVPGSGPSPVYQYDLNTNTCADRVRVSSHCSPRKPTYSNELAAESCSGPFTELDL